MGFDVLALGDETREPEEACRRVRLVGRRQASENGSGGTWDRFGRHGVSSSVHQGSGILRKSKSASGPCSFIQLRAFNGLTSPFKLLLYAAKTTPRLRLNFARLLDGLPNQRYIDGAKDRVLLNFTCRRIDRTGCSRCTETSSGDSQSRSLLAAQRCFPR